LAPIAALTLVQTPNPANWTNPVPPFHVIDTVHYVGTEDLASWLITGAEGHVLIDSGVEQNAPHILAGITTLGFEPRDVKFLLTTQAHFDHVGAHAALKSATGAQIVASAADAKLLEDGGKSDYLFGPTGLFRPVNVDRRVADGDVITLGGVQLRAHLTPGHTPGATTWSTTVKGDDGQPLQAVFVASTHVNEGTKLVGNAVYPRIADDFAGSIKRLSMMKVDVFLAAHMSSMQGIAKSARAKAGAKPNPFIDAAGFKAYIERSRQAFNTELKRQRNSER
jgi:metallo-beta-lactamase class B